MTVTTVEEDGGGTQVQVVEVSGGSGAADAGIQAGDVILAADGQSISVTSDLADGPAQPRHRRYRDPDHPAGTASSST
ncbi:MAG: PDZ domain-containing protein [Dysosmobacter sp.]